MATTTETLYNKIMRLTELTHELSNDIASPEANNCSLQYLEGKIKQLKHTIDHVHGQVKYKIKDGK